MQLRRKLDRGPNDLVAFRYKVSLSSSDYTIFVSLHYFELDMTSKSILFDAMFEGFFATKSCMQERNGSYDSVYSMFMIL